MNNLACRIGYFLCCLLVTTISIADDGYRLWLKYDPLTDRAIVKHYQSSITSILVDGNSETIDVIKRELAMATSGLLQSKIPFINRIEKNGTLVIGNINASSIASLQFDRSLLQKSEEAYLIKNMIVKGKRCIVITSRSDRGVLYGVFYFIRLLQTQQRIDGRDVVNSPAIANRILNHWDNLDRTVERGYAGFSLWDWHRLPAYVDQRYHDYARANSSIGINGTVLTNVNANAQVLTPFYLEKVKALADVFRPYGIKVYLTARFSAPMEIGGLSTADPSEKNVQQWWNDKVKEIYRHVPDFGGFLVKANSEGQPGPQNYKRTHADGANMLADALAPFGGIVMWRAFVYDNEVPVDRTKQAYNEFKPLDGLFRKNVIVQVKNGPLDFQPREPFHPLFGAMEKTPLMMEFQLTQEYLGFATHLAFLSPMWEECLKSKTFAHDKPSTVAEIISDESRQYQSTAIAGVANIGNDRNWCGHPFAQSNWYAFGRLAWDPFSNSSQIADEWARMTFSNDQNTIQNIKSMMLPSRELVVSYMTPLGLHHLMGWNHHYGPAPWIKDKPRVDWTSVYYHRADSMGIGFNRTSTGSNALEQYQQPVRDLYESLDKCPDELLLWFHHVSWNHKMTSGRTLWEEMCYKYQAGVIGVNNMKTLWDKTRAQVDEERYNAVKQLLEIQYQEAVWWRDACLLYFQTFSKKPMYGDFKPAHTLEYYQQLEFPFAPGIKPKW
ncbi:alpha-glucuronidase family glycosyl hydrolase [Pseudochryseolinea flava]|uniref:Xylan alpha-1,2-glucuronidase n=1 Tax=Pseudochryseolinea flava TaxID=2059302 RepID=A0A364XYG4_9BACT|nr:alpha-glucuronidase family glycosyl hydrolase [Pseudochryseolinea flava]RAV99035.1 alpha-glucuronidase [Pseudochryseolinea flava]